MPSASAMPACAAVIQNPTWHTWLGDGGVVLLLQLAGDHRPEDRLEAGLELLRQAGDLLGDVVDADRGRRGEQAEDEDVEPPGAPFDRVGGGERQAAHRQPGHARRMRGASRLGKP